MKTDHIVTASDGERLRVTAYGRAQAEMRCVVYVHGFKGFKDWGFVPYIGEYLSERGFFVVTFNFSHNGIGSNLLEFTELEKFARNTLTREMRELSEIIDACQGGAFGSLTRPRIGLLGHSRGGGVTLLTAVHRPEVRAAAVWASVSTFDRFDEETKRQWRRDGYLETVNQRTGQIMRMNVSVLEEFDKYGRDLLHVEQAVRGFRRPLLIVHGENDDSIPLEEGHRLYEWGDKSSGDLVIVPSTGHTFDARHPFEGTNPKLEFVLEKTAAFFEKHL